MGIVTKTVVPAVYSREPGGALTPAAALHKIIDELGSATPWAMLAFCLAPRPARAPAAPAVETAPRAAPPSPVTVTHSVRGENPPQNNLQQNSLPRDGLPRNHTDFHGAARAGPADEAPAPPRRAPANYYVHYETAPPAPAAALVPGGRG
ncbi:MAG: hypothetical protein LBC18_12755 [Opitutaceae bacterium]|jgi:hypothetical protein|nr:hypothetical protein [Opitutaceae bacterium]